MGTSVDAAAADVVVDSATATVSKDPSLSCPLFNEARIVLRRSVRRQAIVCMRPLLALGGTVATFRGANRYAWLDVESCFWTVG